MIALLVFEILVLYQITTIISESSLFNPLREFLTKRFFPLSLLGYLISCFLCTSVWVGFILSNYLFNFAEYLGYYEISWFWNSMFFSAVVWFIHKIDNSF